MSPPIVAEATIAVSDQEKVGTATFSEQTAPVLEAGHSSLDTPAEEPSMLDRLKGLYESPGDSAARNIFKRPFRKLQSPWNVFRDKEPPTVTAENTTIDVEASELNESTPVPGGETSSLLLQLIEETEAELDNWPQTPGGFPQDPEAFQRRQQNLRLLYLICLLYTSPSPRD